VNAYPPPEHCQWSVHQLSQHNAAPAAAVFAPVCGTRDVHSYCKVCGCCIWALHQRKEGPQEAFSRRHVQLLDIAVLDSSLLRGCWRLVSGEVLVHQREQVQDIQAAGVYEQTGGWDGV